MKRLRRMVTVAATVALATLSFALPASAAPAQPAPPVPVGPECQPSVVKAVMVRLAEVGVSLPAGQKIQYLEVYQTTAGTYAIRPCVVTIPA